MKKTIKKIILMIGLACLANLALSCLANASVTDLIPGTGIKAGSKVGYVTELPKADWTVLIAAIIKMALQICGALAVASFTYGGVMMVTATGNEEKIKKGRGIILWSLLALIIIAISYAIVLGITQLKFFG